jgi:hypothetical protein
MPVAVESDVSLHETAAVVQMENVADPAAYACAERRLDTKLSTGRQLPFASASAVQTNGELN